MGVLLLEPKEQEGVRDTSEAWAEPDFRGVRAEQPLERVRGLDEQR